MPSRLDNRKRLSQFFFRVQVQDSLEFGVYSIQSGGHDAKVDHPCTQVVHKHEIAKVCRGSPGCGSVPGLHAGSADPAPECHGQC
jgi:hypothetical protein